VLCGHQLCAPEKASTVSPAGPFYWPKHYLTTISPPSCLHLAANIEQISGDQPICRTILVQGPAHLLYTAAQQAETAGQDT